ncbi:hypothetical protein HanOQP8_Chr10g0379681 [Helianthus annuus]|nr:hypothetical protein HanIR_Chr10g0493961 [Helianthus annuus]KAJ0698097.1 hypothetical protein HanLR1_Chr10g0376381 [Helianthus annuus]KAJ0701464.1 hypothetical protein HanOQP8_Chr10g0379681 [Helianthus annuus]
MSFGGFRRSVMSIGNDRSINKVHSMDVNVDSSSEMHCELGSFEHQVFRRFHALSGSSADEVLSLNWVFKLLNAFIACQEDFKVVMLENGADFSNPLLDRFVTFFDMIVKALDICNAVRDGVEKIRAWCKHLEIVEIDFDSKSRNVIGEGQFRRAKKSLTDLAMLMLDDNKESSCVFAYGNRPFRYPVPE